MKRSPAIVAVLITLGMVLSSCAALQGPPGPTTFDARLAKLPVSGLPLDRPVTIRWSREMIPFIEAETDTDAAFALGVVHAHLRMGQLAILRHIVTGRLSEMAGPLTTDIDAMLRAFDFGRAASDIHDAMPPETRQWMDSFVDGINHYAGQVDDLPHDMQVAGLEWEPWTAEDTLTLARASGININWRQFLQILSIEDPDLRTRILARIRDLSDTGLQTFGDGQAFPVRQAKALQRALAAVDLVGKSGSNSVVVSPARSQTGSTLIANDPHLGFLMPNIWIIAGVRSPSYEMVGMMVPGTPVFGFGRNRDLAWGGTYLRASIGELVDVSNLPPDQIKMVEHEIGVRFWFDETWTIGETPYGPMPGGTFALAEGPVPYAINWIGHRVTDETTALLKGMKARTVPEFRAAMKTFALPPQTFLIADSSGNIGAMVATTVPVRPPGDPVPVIVSPEQSARNWQDLYDPTELPFILNPPKGVLASANNAPAPDGDRPYRGFYGQDERIRRLEQVLETRDQWSLDTLAKVQVDTVSPLSRELIDALRPRLQAWAPASASGGQAIDLILKWDGDYAADSQAALVFEAFIQTFVLEAYAQLDRTEEGKILVQLGRARQLVQQDMAGLTEAGWTVALGLSVQKAGEMAQTGQVWGDVHRVRVGHLFGALPLVGDRYVERLIPVPGARETIFKTSFNETTEPHTTSFGAQARHMSDLGDPDANYFILFGGQDGRIGSPAFSDQVDRWLSGEFIQLPLGRAALLRTNPVVTVLTP